MMVKSNLPLQSHGKACNYNGRSRFVMAKLDTLFLTELVKTHETCFSIFVKSWNGVFKISIRYVRDISSGSWLNQADTFTI